MFRGFRLRKNKFIALLYKLILRLFFMRKGFIVESVDKEERLWFWPYAEYTDMATNLLADGFEKQVLTITKYLKPGDIFVDIGAYDGLYTLFASKSVKNGAVYSFEPNAGAFRVLKNNIISNRCRNVTLINKAVADKMLQVNFFIDTKEARVSSLFPDASITHTHSREISVASVSLDDYFLKINPVKNVDFVKIDAEGSEMLILNGMLNVIEKFRPKLCIEINGYALKCAGTSPLEVVLFLKRFYPEPILIDEQSGCEIPAVWDELVNLAKTVEPHKLKSKQTLFPIFSNLLLVP
ncbi:MAG: FkbM family methyltransferase [Planctomycetes bacterium]|nr:FkbM family methyltransferase [Planctomycetota bacterium]